MSRGSGLDYQKPSRPTQTIVRPLHARASLATRAGTCFCRPQARMQPTMSLGTGSTPVHTMIGEPRSQVCSVRRKVEGEPRYSLPKMSSTWRRARTPSNPSPAAPYARPSTRLPGQQLFGSAPVVHRAAAAVGGSCQTRITLHPVPQLQDRHHVQGRTTAGHQRRHHQTHGRCRCAWRARSPGVEFAA